MKKTVSIIFAVLVLGSLMFFMFNQNCNCWKNTDSQNPSISDKTTNDIIEANENPQKSNTADTSGRSSSKQYIVYYFHGNMRCPTCHKIENYTNETVTKKFAGEIKQGKVQWKVVNVDEKENQHFVKDYQLFTKSVVLSETENGKETRWKNLDKIWNLVGDQNAFSSYIESEIKNFVKG